MTERDPRNMRNCNPAGKAGALALAAVFIFLAFPSPSARAQEAPRRPESAATVLPRDRGLVPAAPTAILYARPFVSEKPIDFVIDGEKVTRTKGMILVIEADKKLLEPLDAPDFVIFVGGAVAQKVSSGCWSGKVVVMAPEADLRSVPVFFGSRLLPDRMTPADARAEVEKAKAAGVVARPTGELREAARKGGPEPFRVADMNELWYETGPVILEHSPEERVMVESLRKS